MPAQFKTSSEYKTHFKPMRSYKSASFEPAAEQLAPPAGKISDKLGIAYEPPLQRKKRADGPHTTLTPGYYDVHGNGDAYTLLGNQDKFSQNVKYKLRASKSLAGERDVSPPKQPKLFGKTMPAKENVEPEPKPSRAPVVDTSKFRDTMLTTAPAPKEPPEKPSPKRREPQPAQRESKAPEVDTSKFRDTLLRTPLAPREPKDQSAPEIQKVKETMQVKPKRSRSPEKERKKPRERSVEKRSEKVMDRNIDRGEVIKESMKDKVINNMNEFVQTDMTKGVADSAPEAPANYALKYKTGISAPRPSKKMSEYQKQFQWKKGLKSSPLLAAEQIVYKSDPQLAAPKKDVVPKVSEYRQQFKQYKLVTPPEEREVAQEQKKLKVKAKMRKSKSMEDLSPAEIPAAGSAPVITSDNKRLTRESQDVPKSRPVPKVPRAKPRRYKSEYKSNFAPPHAFEYEDGAWKGANPPHLRASVPEETKDKDGETLTNWFAEVLELRRKAQEYRLRAQGTHFSREHLVQLMAKQADAWDMSTARSSSTMLSALSLESGASIQAQKRRQARKYRDGTSTAATMASEDDHDEQQERISVAEDYQSKRRQAWEEEESPEPESPDSEAYAVDEEGGRLVTPQLRYMTGPERKPRRHHLDRTTPSVGGALLTSPPPPKYERKKAVSSKTKTFKRAPIVRNSWAGPEREQEAQDEEEMTEYTIEEEEEPYIRPLAGQKTYAVNKGSLAPTPTCGMPSRDTHFLRDEEASTDRALHTQYVYSPQKGQAKEDISGKSHQRRSRPKPSGLDTIKESYGQTYSVNKTRASPPHMSWTIDGGLPVARRDEEDDDVLSLSARSIASSCSLASEVLERARKRKEEFWGRQGIATR